jgi:hypothetical protein
MATLIEDFEDTSYVTTISGAWARTSGSVHGGSWSMQCDSPAANTSATHTLTIPSGATSVRLWASGESFDESIFEVQVNGVAQFEYDLETGGWQQSPEISLVGATTLAFFIGAGFFGNPVFFVDDITFTTGGGEEPPPSGPVINIDEDFEDTTYNIAFSGAWARSNTAAHGGTWSLRNDTAGHSTTRNVDFTLPVGARTVQFWYRVSSEAGWDHFRFLVGNTQMLEASGNTGLWVQSPVYDVSAATVVRFRFVRDSEGSAGSNCAWVDDIRVTIPGGFIGWGIPVY